MRFSRLTHLYLILFFAIVQSAQPDFTLDHAILHSAWSSADALHSHDCGNVEFHRPLMGSGHCLACSRLAGTGEAVVLLEPQRPSELVSIVRHPSVGKPRVTDTNLIYPRGPPVLSS
ncbi:MAG: hypothetical protein FJ215_07905 [Ignavibacteria bacterium]|nr:hypothetical protein [Ignavibacteria bacterium]